MKIRFAFDFVSPYAYLGWHRAKEALGTVATLEPMPVLLAALLDAHGTLGPAEVPAKRKASRPSADQNFFILEEHVCDFARDHALVIARGRSYGSITFWTTLAERRQR